MASSAPCCLPQAGPADMPRPAARPAGTAGLDLGLVDVPGGRALVGTDRPVLEVDGEAPLRLCRVAAFRMMATTVTNAMFARFVEATGHVTDSERFGWSFVFAADIAEAIGPTRSVPGAPWWRRVEGANWRLIHGPGSHDSAWQEDHPVVHVSLHDALAFAAWCGGRLPCEAEWEHAARGGLGDVPYPWGEREPDDDRFMPCNIWQGSFPAVDLGRDGYRASAPARSFEPNGYGLYNMCGNVWEWTSERYKVRSLKKAARRHAAAMQGMHLLKGGSFLCHKSYCHRYRIAARTGTTADTATAHQGFRLVVDHGAGVGQAGAPE